MSARIGASDDPIQHLQRMPLTIGLWLAVVHCADIVKQVPAPTSSTKAQVTISYPARAYPVVTSHWHSLATAVSTNIAERSTKLYMTKVRDQNYQSSMKSERR